MIQYGTCQQKHLALTAGEAAGIGFGNLRIQFQRQVPHVVTQTHKIQRRPNLVLVRMAPVAQAYIFKDCPREQPAELEYGTDAPPEGFRVQPRHRLSIVEHISVVGLFHAHQYLQEGALSASTLPHNCNLLPRHNMHVDAVETAPGVARIGKVNVLRPDLPLEPVHIFGGPPRLVSLLQQGADVLAKGTDEEHILHDVGQAGNRGDDQRVSRGEGHIIAAGEPTPHGLPQQNHRSQRGQRRHDITVVL